MNLMSFIATLDALSEEFESEYLDGIYKDPPSHPECLTEPEWVDRFIEFIRFERDQEGWKE